MFFNNDTGRRSIDWINAPVSRRVNGYFHFLLEVHKLLYFLQAAKEPLRLRFSKGQYGPYSENLRHVLLAIEGHLVSGYSDDGDTPDKQLELIPGAIQDADDFLKEHGDTKERFEKVTRLVDGFETPFGLELLSTVHWVVTEEGAADLRSIQNHTYSWNPTKRKFSPAQISLAAERMREQGWIA